MLNQANLTGYHLSDAEAKLNTTGKKYIVTETSSPRRDIISDNKRVVRHLQKDGVEILTVCSY